MDNKTNNPPAIAAAIGSGNEIGYWTKTRTKSKDGLQTPQQHPLARVRA